MIVSNTVFHPAPYLSPWPIALESIHCWLWPPNLKFLSSCGSGCLKHTVIPCFPSPSTTLCWLFYKLFPGAFCPRSTWTYFVKIWPRPTPAETPCGQGAPVSSHCHSWLVKCDSVFPDSPKEEAVDLFADSVMVTLCPHLCMGKGCTDVRMEIYLGD